MGLQTVMLTAMNRVQVLLITAGVSKTAEKTAE